MKVANLIDITPEEIAQLEKVGYVGMNVNLATGRIDLVKAEEDYEEENCCECDEGEDEECGFCSGKCRGCLYEDECDCDFDEDEEIEDYTINDVIAEGLRAIGIIR